MDRRHALKTLLAAAPVGFGPLAAAVPAWPPRTAEGWTLPTAPPVLRFPRDHFLHPDFQTEWWYLTGHLHSLDGGREFGFQLTFFRRGLRPPGSPGARSRFLVDQQPLAHFAISDPQNSRLVAAQRLERAAFDRAGFDPAPAGGAASANSAGSADDPAQARLAWIGDWTLELDGEGLRARAAQPGQELELRLEPSRPDRPWVLHGEAGLSRKGPGNLHNSCYYSATRLGARGRLRLGEEEFQVEGLAWFDREWSSQTLDEDARGWDWFSLQLDEGRDLMLFQLRDAQGQRLPGGHGTLVEADGRSRNLTAPEFELTPLLWWTSPHDGARYPVNWKVEVPNDGLQLMVAARFEDQQVNLDPLHYWEGMVAVRGQNPGRGYLEMTGYDRDSTLSSLRG